MVHMRETRSSASEVKFIIDPALAPRIRQWTRTHLQPDPHGTGTSGDEYDTSSLYFDTRKLDVFNRRGSFGRAKFRVRRYSPSGVIFLERKLRRPGMLVKRRTLATAETLPRLETRHVDLQWDGEWFHRRLLFRRLHPVCQISFHRAARIVITTDGIARATLDTDFRASHADGARFTDQPHVGFLGDLAILELKFRGRLPPVFRRLVEEFALAPQTASKFRLGMSALGHVPAGTENVSAPTGPSYV
jgi:hypothetical protein